MTTDKRIEAIRNHPKVGRGSCTAIDECFTDEELIQGLDESEAKTEEAAIRWALKSEGLRVEDALNKRWGEDTDPELTRYREWMN